MKISTLSFALEFLVILFIFPRLFLAYFAVVVTPIFIFYKWWLGNQKEVDLNSNLSVFNKPNL